MPPSNRQQINTNPINLAAMQQPLNRPDIAKGIEMIRKALTDLPPKMANGSGVYRMLDEHGKVLYVGKAKQLKSRVLSYTRIAQLSRRIRLMVSITHQMIFVSTHTEAEALLLEAELIKRLQPRFNILLRDDKSFPEVLIRTDHAFPRLLKHRGTHNVKGEYFGPYANVRAVNVALDELQKSFRLRTCSDSVFRHRTRPCLLHQMKRCSAPCVALIDQVEYQQLIRQTRDFLRGRSIHVQQELAQAMELASQKMDYEKAAEYRDRLSAITQMQSRYHLPSPHRTSADVMALALGETRSCVYVYLFRQGRHCGAQAYFIQHAKAEQEVLVSDSDKYPSQEEGQEEHASKILSAFIGQFYQARDVPKLLLLSQLPDEPTLLSEALCRHAGHAIQIHTPLRGDKRKLVENAVNEAVLALKQRQGQLDQHQQQWQALSDMLNIPEPIRIEAYDNSHLNGSQPVGVMIVANSEGFERKAYRKFNIKGRHAAGDDYAFMHEVLSRRLARIGQDDTTPDLLLIDGGKGQLGIVTQLLEENGLTQDIAVAGIVKGAGRDAKNDRLLFQDRSIRLAEHPEVGLLVQRLRDEAHRFAVGAQRTRRKSRLQHSVLDDVPGIGNGRKRALLRHFGSAKAVMNAGVEDLANAPTISHALAQKLYDYFH